MAGGPFAQLLNCMVCAFDGIVTRAERVYEGVEDDHYRCDAGHAFGVDWRRGGPTEPAWPLSAEMVAAIEASAEAEPAAAGDMVADTAVRRFVRGPSVSDSAAVLAWLADRQAEQRRLRLPVVLVRGDVGFNLRDARIGGRELLKIRCDDSALGVGLDDRAQQVCRDAASCALWLEGFWRGGEARVFAVVKVGASVTDAELADAAAEREATDERVG
jgi:hypothetical protein